MLSGNGEWFNQYQNSEPLLEKLQSPIPCKAGTGQVVCFCCREEDGEEELEVSENEQEEEELEEALAKAHEEEKKLNKRSALLSLCALVWGG